MFFSFIWQKILQGDKTTSLYTEFSNSLLIPKLRLLHKNVQDCFAVYTNAGELGKEAGASGGRCEGGQLH